MDSYIVHTDAIVPLNIASASLMVNEGKHYRTIASGTYGDLTELASRLNRAIQILEERAEKDE